MRMGRGPGVGSRVFMLNMSKSIIVTAFGNYQWGGLHFQEWGRRRAWAASLQALTSAPQCAEGEPEGSQFRALSFRGGTALLPAQSCSLDRASRS
jgi:hypothetical protein